MLKLLIIYQTRPPPARCYQIICVKTDRERGTAIQQKEKQHNASSWLTPGVWIQCLALTTRTLCMYLQQMTRDQNIRGMWIQSWLWVLRVCWYTCGSGVWCCCCCCWRRSCCCNSSSSCCCCAIISCFLLKSTERTVQKIFHNAFSITQISICCFNNKALQKYQL